MTTEPAPGSSEPLGAWRPFVDSLLRWVVTAEAVEREVGDAVDDDGRLLPGVDAIERAFPPELTAEADGIMAALAEHVDEARSNFRHELETVPSALGSLGVKCELDLEEIEVLAVLAAVDIAAELQATVAMLQHDRHRRMPTLGLLRRMFPEPHCGPMALRADGPLRRAELVEVEEGPPWASRVASLPGYVAWALQGDDSLDPDLPTGAWVATGSGEPPGSDALLLIAGADRRTRLLTALAEVGGPRALVSPCPSGDEWKAVVRQASLAAMPVILEMDDDLPEEIRAGLDRADHLTWVVCSRTELPLHHLPRRPWRELLLESGRVPAEEWDAIAGADAAGRACALDREQAWLVLRACEGGAADVSAGIRRLSAGPLEKLATRVKPDRAWDDLVLPAPQLELVRQLVSHYRQRSLVYGAWGFRPAPSPGVVALFTGQSGTGKTLAAEVVAAALGLDLFKIDLSSVVSKYIGETEKNLEAVFGAAETGECVLFFDEADALLGKRSAVSDATDRYANVETAYLLQRIERHRGMLLLATNLAANIDTAFTRRIGLTIQFPVPAEPERLTIWQKSFPPSCPTGEIDFGWLAKSFVLPGGPIRNIALGAAFLAAEGSGMVTMEHVLVMLRQELQKLGRLVDPDEFGDYAGLLEATVGTARGNGDVR